MKKHVLTILFVFFVIQWLPAQQKVYNSGELLHSLNKLKVVGSAMYVAAHPDDENTLLITWLANEKNVRTAYTAITRGDGGQNLIGSEKNEFAGLLRTNELLAARSIDGGEQYFTRANDFGYSKTTEEALATWGKERVLSDLVYRIRKFQPDVIITRFPPDERAGHGHHSASSLLAEEAFDAAADKKAFPEQLTEVEVWQAKRLLWNFYNRGFTNTPPDDDSKFIQVDIGGYNSLLGESYGEIGSRARSSHKSQGFGASLQRGERMETLKHTKGNVAENDLFDGINTTWSRIKGGEIMTVLIDDIIRNFNPENPENSVLALNQMYILMSTLPSSPLLEYKKNQLEDLIIQFTGIHLEAISDTYMISKKDVLKGDIRVINRSNLKVNLEAIEIKSIGYENKELKNLGDNDFTQISFYGNLNENISNTQPYWLLENHPIGYYNVKESKNIGLPMAPNEIVANVTLNIEGLEIKRTLPVAYKYVEPSFGEIYRPLEVRPSITVTANVPSLVFNSDDTQEILVTVKSGKDSQKGYVGIDVPTGWDYEPKNSVFNLEKKNDEVILKFNISPSKAASKSKLKILATVGSEQFGSGLNIIKYAHIPEITTFPKTEISIVKLDLKKKGKKVGYIMGSGDEIPEALRQIGYEVVLLKEENINDNLSSFKAIIIGSRAYSLFPWLAFQHPKLMAYVKNGGNLICQFQTFGSYGDFKNKMGPYDFDLGRDRVSQEDAEIRFLNPESLILNKPNKITAADFEGWVQERGLYFASKWSDEYQTIFSMNDTNEDKKIGSLIHAKYGSGNYIYTGLSLFRQLPEGVPGAYRLLANMISL
jgi:LmbE family N-acetylglucosaminyl deacetylase